MCNKLNLHNGGKKWCSPNLALLILRLSLGIIFIAHGLSKINNMEGTVGFFANFGIPAIFAYLVAWIEFLGGIALILGVYTWVVGILIALIMVFAIILVKTKTGESAELDFMAFASALTLAFIGPGKFTMLKTKSRYCALGCSDGKCEDDDSCSKTCCTGEKCECGDCDSCK